MELVSPPAIKKYPDSNNNIFPDLQYAVYKLLKARSTLDKTIQVLIETQPDLVVPASERRPWRNTAILRKGS